MIRPVPIPPKKVMIKQALQLREDTPEFRDAWERVEDLEPSICRNPLPPKLGSD